VEKNNKIPLLFLLLTSATFNCPNSPGSNSQPVGGGGGEFVGKLGDSFMLDDLPISFFFT
jgi:hypothetical protein